MAFTRLSGGDILKGIDRRYQLTYAWCFDSTSKTLTLPSNTDFILLFNAYYDPSTSTGTTSGHNNGTNGTMTTADTPLVILTEVGQTAKAYRMLYSYHGTEGLGTWTSITWTSATKATVTRSSSGGACQVFAGRYTD